MSEPSLVAPCWTTFPSLPTTDHKQPHPATAVRLPYGVRSIAANAFDMPFIQKIYIPSSVTSIDASAFGGQRSLRIYGMTGSYAETYAGQNGYTFIPLAEEPD